MTVAALAASAATAQRSASSAVQEGHAGAYWWSVAAGGSSGSVCLSVTIRHRLGRFAYDRSKFRRCSVGLEAREAPLVSGGTELSGGRKGGMTVLAVAVAAGVDRVRLAFADGSRTTISPRPLLAKTIGSGLRGLRYAVVALPAHRCLTGLVSEAAGRVVWAGERGRCLPDWSQPANLGELSSSPQE